jgi:hypothetical protein
MKTKLILSISALVTITLLAIFLTTCQSDPPKPKLTIEEIREQRQIKYNEAGKDVNQFIRGTLGKPKN